MLGREARAGSRGACGVERRVRGREARARRGPFSQNGALGAGSSRRTAAYMERALLAER